MKKLTLAVAFLAIAFNMAFSQKEEKYVKMYYKNFTVETNEATITVDDAVSTDGETKFKIRISNKTADYLIYKPEESRFIIDGKEHKPKKDKWEIIAPNDNGSIVINLAGSGLNSVKNYSFQMEGLYKVTISDNGIQAPDFTLPPSQNDFKAGPFSVSLNKLEKETDKTSAKFKCTYNGDKIGLVFPSRIAVKMPDGKEYANVKSGKSKPIFMKPGEDESFTAAWERMQGGKEMDMQKAEMIIKWNATFTEITPVKLKTETLSLEFDEATSNEKGK